MNEEVKSGLGGWLILVGIGVVFSPIKLVNQMKSLYVPLFQDGSIELLTNPGSEYYIPGFKPLLYGEIIVNLITFILGLFLIYLFFSKKALFPKLYIFLAVWSLFFILVDVYLGHLLFPNEVIFDRETIRDTFAALFTVLIWVPYMRMSKRVKATFVN
jgi:hypothetical protein